MSNERSVKGFTLIEILAVVILVVALGYFAFAVIRNATFRANDARRERDLTIIKQALDLYFTDNQSYPTDLTKLKSDGYMTEVPTNTVQGKPEAYTYEVSSEEKPKDYVLYVFLENKKAKETLPGLTSCGDPAQKGMGIVNPTKKQACFRISSD